MTVIDPASMRQLAIEMAPQYPLSWKDILGAIHTTRHLLIPALGRQPSLAEVKKILPVVLKTVQAYGGDPL